MLVLKGLSNTRLLLEWMYPEFLSIYMMFLKILILQYIMSVSVNPVSGMSSGLCA